MTALPINPTSRELMSVVLGKMPRLTPNEERRALFQAGVEAERARAAAEATVEWGVKDPDVDNPRYVRDASDERAARHAVRAMRPAVRVVVRRTVGPWEVQS
jgi:hypothetical protein